MENDNQNLSEENAIIYNSVIKIIPTIEKHIADIKVIRSIEVGLQEISDKINGDISLENDLVVIQLNFLLSRIDLELCYILKNLVNSKTKYEQNYFIKLGYLNIYEALNAYNKEIKSIKSLIPDSSNFQKLLKQINQIINEFKNDYSFDDKMKIIRNKIIGHFEISIKDYFDIIENFNYKESVIMIYRFLLSISFIQDFILELYTNIGNKLPANFNFEDLFEKVKIRLEEEMNKLKNMNIS